MGIRTLVSSRFHVLSFMASLKAAREFGLEQPVADAIAVRFDPRRGEAEHLVDELAAALIDRGVVRVPGSV